MSARDKILAKLRASLAGTTPLADSYDQALVTEPWSYAPEQRIARLRELLEAVHGETHLTTAAGWPALVAEALAERAIDDLLMSPETAHGQQFAGYLALHAGTIRLKAYDKPVEAWKEELFFATPASLTGTLGGIAATGSLILWPTPAEPRLMSLVPPLHIALLKASEIHDNLYQVLQAQRWAEGLPTNALLVSGPSKTADIQQTLAYGAHGPKELIVLILEDA